MFACIAEVKQKQFDIEISTSCAWWDTRNVVTIVDFATKSQPGLVTEFDQISTIQHRSTNEGFLAESILGMASTWV